MAVKKLVLNLPTFGLAVSTRAAIGAGIALLVSARIPVERRRKIGLALVSIGAVTTIPILRAVRRTTDAALEMPA